MKNFEASEFGITGTSLELAANEKDFKNMNVHLVTKSKMSDDEESTHSNGQLQQTKSHQGLENQFESSKNALDLINEHEQRNMEVTLQKSSVLSQYKSYEVYAWGLNDNHQLGQVGYSKNSQLMLSPTSRNVLIPRQIKDINFKIKQIACGSQHTLLLSEDGDIYALGNNSHGQLGLSVQNYPIVSQPKKIEFKYGKIGFIACNQTHSVLITENGDAFACGLNNCQQLGIDSSNQYRVIYEEFTQLQGKYLDASCGPDYTVFIGPKDTIICGTEFNYRHQNLRENYMEVRCGKSSFLATGSNSTFKYDLNLNVTEFQQQFKEIAAYNDNYAGLTYDNKVFTWKDDHEPKELPSDVNSVAFSGISIG